MFRAPRLETCTRATTRLLVAAAVLVGLAACDETPPPTTPAPSPDGPVVTPSRVLPDNPPASFWGDLGPAQLPAVVERAPVNMAAAHVGDLAPASVEATLQPGETLLETKTVTVPDAPPLGDVLFLFDLTGSMGGELTALKANAVDIMNDVTGVITDVQFGLISHEDYPFFVDNTGVTGCNYSTTYGNAGAGDEAYRLDHTMTSTTADVATAIGAMVLKNGQDFPESYTRALWESVAELTATGSDPDFGDIGWRTGSKKIVVAFNDAVPHDCAYDAIIGGSGDTGTDPGRDDTPGTADDLEILPVLSAMDAANVTLINLHSGGDNTLWQAYAEETGGTNFAINADGSFPGGADPGAEIAALIEAEVSSVDEVTLDVCPGDEAFSDWIVNAESVDPAEPLPTGVELDIEMGPPAATTDGVYEFDVCAFADGTVIGHQDVTITVVTTIEADIDIKPGSWPNSINVNNKRGVIPVAILGSEDFDVSDVDVSTLVFEGATPIHDPAGHYEDVNSDGYTDVVTHYSTSETDLVPGDTEGCIEGQTLGGTDIEGCDAVRTVPPGP